MKLRTDGEWIGTITFGGVTRRSTKEEGYNLTLSTDKKKDLPILIEVEQAEGKVFRCLSCLSEHVRL